MDHFERQLAQLMHSTHEHAPFEPRHRERLRAAVRTRRRTRALQQVGGFALAVAGLGVALFLLPGRPHSVEPSSPRPEPATSPTAPAASPSSTPTSSATGTQGTSSPPGATGDTTSAPPPTTTSPPPSSTENTQDDPSTDATSVPTSTMSPDYG